MKKLFFITACLFISNLLFAQTKALPHCKTINKELTEVNHSFDNIVERFKSKEDKISLVKTYFSEFSICGEKGKIKDYGRNIEFIFYFTDAYYHGTRLEFRDFYKKDKEMTSSRRNIKLLLSYKDPVDETTAYSVSLIFEYYPKR